METHSSILAWKIPWTEEPGRLQSMESQRVRHDWVTSLHSLPVLLPGKSHGQRSLEGYSLWGHKESDTTERFHFTSFEHSLALPFFGTGIKTDLFQSCSHCWVFQICWHTECSTLIASSFRIWNSSAGIPSPPLALFVVMLPKAHLTLHSRMSGSRWVITPLWFIQVIKTFFCVVIPYILDTSS